MSAALAVSHHAVERFVERWRPGLAGADARAELEALAANASPTRRRTLKGDARIYVVATPEGESIPLAVRDGLVITVLPVDEREPGGSGPDAEALADHEAAVTAMTAAALTSEPGEPVLDLAKEYELARLDRNRRENAEKVLRDWREGKAIRRDAVDRACAVLDVDLPERSTAGVLRVDGGRWDGLRVDLQDGDAARDIVARLLLAMMAHP